MNTHVTDFEPLHKSKNLKVLTVSRAQLSDKEYDALAKALPDLTFEMVP